MRLPGEADMADMAKMVFSGTSLYTIFFYILYFLESEIENFAIFAINISKPLKIKAFSYGKTYGIFISKNHTMAFTILLPCIWSSIIACDHRRL